MGGTMRLGAWTCKLTPGSFAIAPTASSKSASATAPATNLNRIRKSPDNAGLQITGRTPDEKITWNHRSPETTRGS